VIGCSARLDRRASPYLPWRHETNCLAAWVASEGVTLTSGKVSSWLDRTKRYSAVQATDAKRPVVVASDAAFNGRATIDMSGGAWLATSSFTAIAGPYTAYFVGTAGDTTAYRLAFYGGNSNVFLWRAEITSGVVVGNGGHGQVTSTATGTTKQSNCLVLNGITGSIYTNGTLTGGPAASTPVENIVQFWIGTLDGTNWPFSGKAGDLLLFGVAHDAAARARVTRSQRLRYNA
jgi:hypothetical protein